MCATTGARSSASRTAGHASPARRSIPLPPRWPRSRTTGCAARCRDPRPGRAAGDRPARAARQFPADGDLGARPAAETGARPPTVRPQARVRQIRLDDGLVRTSRHERGRTPQWRGARDAVAGRVGLHRLHRTEERRPPALLVRLDDDLRPVGQADAEDTAGGGAVEEAFLDTGAELVDAEAVDDRRDRRRVTGAEHLDVDGVGVPLGLLGPDHRLHGLLLVHAIIVAPTASDPRAFARG